MLYLVMLCLWSVWMSWQDGSTALQFASWGGCSDVAKLLLDKGADVNAANNVSNIILYNYMYVYVIVFTLFAITI